MKNSVQQRQIAAELSRTLSQAFTDSQVRTEKRQAENLALLLKKLEKKSPANEAEHFPVPFTK